MSRLSDAFEKAFIGGGLDLQMLMERYDVRFENLSLHNVKFIESECRELRDKFEEAEKVECFKTRRLQDVGWSDEAYFSLEEYELVKKLSKSLIDKGFFGFTVEKIKISKIVLEQHISRRKEYEKK